MQQDENLLIDPEEQMEGRLVHKMALVIVAIVAIGILVLAMRPWLERFQEQNAEQE